MTMTKKTVVLDVFLDKGQTVVFTHDMENELDAEPPTQLTLSRFDWKEFGQPRTVTVVIVPDDLLNDEDVELVVTFEDRHGAATC